MTTPIPEKEPSMEDILRTIRGVIAGKDDSPEAPIIPTSQAASSSDDILELTEVVEEDGSVHTLKEKKQEGDILIDIDKATIRDTPSMSSPLTTDTSPLPAERPEVPVVPGAPISLDIAPIIPSGSSSSVEKKPEETLTSPPDILPSSDVETKNEEMLPLDRNKKNTSPTVPIQETSFTPEHEVKKRLISEESAASSMEALQNLVNTIPKTRDHGPQMRTGTTLEDLVIEALKPPLSQWLEVHLSSIVKQLVEKEIKRLMPKDE